jgi:hypothetical protein
MGLLKREEAPSLSIRSLRTWVQGQSMKMNPSINTIIRNLKSPKVYTYMSNNIGIDEIPIVLLELNESALAYITREQFDKAMLLL